MVMEEVMQVIKGEVIDKYKYNIIRWLCVSVHQMCCNYQVSLHIRNDKTINNKVNKIGRYFYV